MARCEPIAGLLRRAWGFGAGPGTALACATWMLLGATATAAERGVLRLVLLPSGDRASLFVELDEPIPDGTSIEATDNLSIEVVIGPIKGTIVDEVLRATERSPLVSQVRVRGISLGGSGKFVAVQIAGKSPFSGSVRQVQSRVYIDLEPLSQSPPPGPPATAGARKETTTLGPGGIEKASLASAAGGAATASAAQPDDIFASAEKLARSGDVKALERLVAKPVASIVLAAKLEQILKETRERKALARDPSAPLPSLAAPEAPDSVAANPPPSPATPPSEPVSPAPAPFAQLTTASPEATLAISGIRSPMSTSAESRLPGPAPANSRVFRQRMRSLKPELEKLGDAMNVLSPGSLVTGELAIKMEMTLAQLRTLEPPDQLGPSYKNACGALAKLVGGWVVAPDGELMLAVGDDPSILESARTTLREYLLAFDRFDAQSVPLAQQN